MASKDLTDVISTALGSHARARFRAITMGLSFCEAADRAIAALERGTWSDNSPLSGLLAHGHTVVSHLQTAPPGNDGTGRDATAAFLESDRRLAALEKAVAGHAEIAISVLRSEAERQVVSLENELQDADLLRWTVETPEEWDLVLRTRSGALTSLAWLERLGVDASAFRSRLAAFEASVSPYLETNEPGNPSGP